MSLFAGQYLDQETELYYNYFRYYDPAMGHYITFDPLGLDGGLNTYSYVGGNPIRFIDPFGLEKLILLNLNSILNDKLFLPITANSYPDIDGYLLMFGHGSPKKMADDRAGGWVFPNRKIITPKDLVEIVMKDSKWKEGMPVMLMY